MSSLDGNLVRQRFGKRSGTPRERGVFAMHYSNEPLRWIGSRALIGQGRTRGTTKGYANGIRAESVVIGNQSAAQASKLFISVTWGHSFVRSEHRCQILIIQMDMRGYVENTRRCLKSRIIRSLLPRGGINHALVRNVSHDKIDIFPAQPLLNDLRAYASWIKIE